MQSLLLGLLTVVVIGFGKTTIDASKDIAVIKADVRNIQNNMTDKMGDRYTGTDAAAYREFDTLRAVNMQVKINDNAKRIKDLEDRFNGND